MSTVPTCRSRFTRPVFLWAVAALVTELTVHWLSNHGFHLPAPRLVRLLPVVPGLFFLLALVRAIRKMDELQQRISLEAAFIAFILTLVLAFVFDGLQEAAIYRAPWDSLGTPMMFLWTCAYIFSAWRYR